MIIIRIRKGLFQFGPVLYFLKKGNPIRGVILTKSHCLVCELVTFFMKDRIRRTNSCLEVVKFIASDRTQTRAACLKVMRPNH